MEGPNTMPQNQPETGIKNSKYEIGKHERNSFFQSPDKLEFEEEKSAIATESINSFKLKPEFVGTANKKKRSFQKFDSGLVPAEKDYFESPKKMQANQFGSFLKNTFTMRKNEEIMSAKTKLNKAQFIQTQGTPMLKHRTNRISRQDT